MCIRDRLRTGRKGETSETIRTRIEGARKIQQLRYQNGPFTMNANMSESAIDTHCTLTPQLGQILQKAMEALTLSARAYNRILKVARTIADLSESNTIELNHLTEAIQYRSLDRRNRT